MLFLVAVLIGWGLVFGLRFIDRGACVLWYAADCGFFWFSLFSFAWVAGRQRGRGGVWTSERIGGLVSTVLVVVYSVRVSLVISLLYNSMRAQGGLLVIFRGITFVVVCLAFPVLMCFLLEMPACGRTEHCR